MSKNEYKMTNETSETLLRELPKLPEGTFWRIKKGLFAELLDSEDLRIQIVRRMEVLERKVFRFLGMEFPYGQYVVPRIEFDTIDTYEINEVKSLDEVVKIAKKMKAKLEKKNQTLELVEQMVGDYEVGHD